MLLCVINLQKVYIVLYLSKALFIFKALFLFFTLFRIYGQQYSMKNSMPLYNICFHFLLLYQILQNRGWFFFFCLFVCFLTVFTHRTWHCCCCCCCCCCQVASVMSDSVQPHGLQPTRLLRPWDSPGKNTGVGCHFLLQNMAQDSTDSECDLLLLLLKMMMKVMMIKIP